MIRKYMLLCLLLFLANCGLSAPVASQEYATFADYQGQADVVYYVTEDRDAQEWYIGKCTGDTVVSGNRLKIYESSVPKYFIPKVRLTSNKYESSRVLCVK